MRMAFTLFLWHTSADWPAIEIMWAIETYAGSDKCNYTVEIEFCRDRVNGKVDTVDGSDSKMTSSLEKIG